MGTRHLKPPGGATSHNLFSWDDGSLSSRAIEPESRKSPGGQESQVGSLLTGRGQLVEEEPKKMRPGATAKLQELSGSGIFSHDSEPAEYSQPSPQAPFAPRDTIITPLPVVERPSVKVHHPAGGASSMIFGDDSGSTPTKLMSPFKQMELNGTSETKDDVLRRKVKQKSMAKQRELSGTVSILNPSEEELPVVRQETPPHLLESSPEDEKPNVRIINPARGTSQIFQGDAPPEPPARRVSEAKVNDILGTGKYIDEVPSLHVSEAKRRELQGCNIFGNEQPKVRGTLGHREPPGGKTTIALI